MDELRVIYGDENVGYILSTDSSIEESLKESDLVVGAVYVISKQAPKVVKNSMLENMKPGAVMVDISIDQGGCFESGKPTTMTILPMKKMELFTIASLICQVLFL